MEQLTSWNILTSFIKEHPSLFVVYCVIVMALPINEVLLPQLYGKVLGNLKTNQPIRRYLVPIIVLLLIVQTLYFSNDMLEVHLYPKFHAFLRDITLDYVVQTKSTNLTEIESGKLIAKLIRFPAVFASFIDDFRNAIVPFIIIYIIVIVYMYIKDKYLGLFILIIATIVTALTFISMRSCNVYSQKRDVLYYKLFDHVDEILRNIISVLNNNRYQDEKRHLDSYQIQYVDYCRRALWCVTKYKFIVFVAFAIIMFLFVTRTGKLYTTNLLDHASLITIVIIMLFFFGTLMKHTALFKDLMYRYGTISECLEMFNNGVNNKRPEPLQSKWQELNSAQVPYCLELNQISYSYDGIKPALQQISLQIRCRENIAIMGQIGSGKSTLLKLLMKYKRPTTGELYLNGIPYSQLPEHELRAKIGYTAQNSILFNRSILENIRYSNKNATTEQVQHMIDHYGLTEFFKRFPMGLDTKAGINGSNLSGGEKQIIWILRVILQDPQIVLLDEPTSAMDEATKEYILKLLMMVTKEKTVLCITHDANILKYFDRVLYLKDGSLA